MPNGKNKQNAKTVAEFFAGIGLMRMGLEKAGWTVDFANDIDAEKREMYQGHFGDDGHFLLGDIHEIPPEKVPSVALATASFPCNDLSLAGGRDGLAGKNSSAFWGFIRILEGMKERRPPLVLIENVVGFLTSRGGADLAQALEALNRLGYKVDPFILDAAWFVPQSRKRLFVVGRRAELAKAEATPANWLESPLRPAKLSMFIAAHPEIGWCIRNLPEPPASGARLEDIIENLPSNYPKWWSEDRARYLLSQMSPAHRETAEAMIQGIEWSYGTVFRRIRKGKSMAELRTDGMAGCLRTPRGGSGRQILFQAGRGKYRVRLVTPRECARLMGAGDFKITAKLNKALFGFGDAVCVPAIEWIARNYLNDQFPAVGSLPAS